MNNKEGTVEVVVEELKDSRTTDGGASIVLDTTARIDGERRDTLIEVQHVDAPSVAVALMSPAGDADAAPAMHAGTGTTAANGSNVANGTNGVSGTHVTHTAGGNRPISSDAAADGALPAALVCLAAGVIDGAPSRGVRLHLQFDSGQVLPVELSFDAAAALTRGLTRHLEHLRAAPV